MERDVKIQVGEIAVWLRLGRKGSEARIAILNISGKPLTDQHMVDAVVDACALEFGEITYKAPFLDS